MNRTGSYEESLPCGGKLKISKASMPKDGEFSKTGEMGMSIRIGGFAEGVCLRSYHMAIKTEEGIQGIIDSYRYAVRMAPQIQQFLASL